jgi:hypothetical protein
MESMAAGLKIFKGLPQMAISHFFFAAVYFT